MPASLQATPITAQCQGPSSVWILRVPWFRCLSSSGVELAGSKDPLSSNGNYRLPLHTPIKNSGYLIIQVTKNGRSLRALVTGYSQGLHYEENDTFISPDTEAAVLLCSLGQKVSLFDYALFLRSCVHGRFDANLPVSYTYPYPEVQEKLSRHIDEPMNTELIFGDDFWKETCWMPPCETQFFEPGVSNTVDTRAPFA